MVRAPSKVAPDPDVVDPCHLADVIDVVGYAG